jgi:parvulin-like peptidyl-prolyl isomerase
MTSLLRSSLAATSALLLEVAILAAVPSAYADPVVIARVGDTDIKADEIKPYLDKLSSADRDALAKNPSALNQAVRKLIIQQLVYKEAISSGWDKQPDVIKQLDQVRQNAIAETYIQSVAKVPDGYPSADDIQAAYDAKKALLILPRQLRLAQIYIPRPTQDDKAALAKAEARLDAAVKNLKQPNADFLAVGQAIANDPENGARAGEIGWVAETNLQPEIRSRIAGLTKNAVTDTIKQPDGWYILKVLEVKESRQATLDEVSDQLARALRSERARLNQEAYLTKLQQQNPVSINELDLSKLVANPKN